MFRFCFMSRFGIRVSFRVTILFRLADWVRVRFTVMVSVRFKVKV